MRGVDNAMDEGVGVNASKRELTDDLETGIEDLVIESDGFKNYGGYHLRGIYSSF